MKRIALAFALAWAWSAAAADPGDQGPGDQPPGDQGPSALVTTIMPHQGTLDQKIASFGFVESGPGNTTTLNLLHSAQIRAVRVSPGQMVRQGAELIEVTSDPSARLAYQQSISSLALARSERARTARLVEQRIATISQLAQADKALADAQAAWRAQIETGGAKGIEKIRAPFAGQITNVAIQTGDTVGAGSALILMTKQGGFVVRVGIAPENRTSVKPGDIVGLEAFDQPGKPVSGTVATIGGAVDPKTGQVDVLVDPAQDSENVLIPGEHVSAAITTGQLTGWIVPRDAVLSDGAGLCVYQADGGKAVRVAVRALGTIGDQTIIDGPIDPSRPLVIQGNYQLSDGMIIRVADPKQSPNGGSDGVR